MIKLNEICFAYDSEPVLNYFSMEIEDGECVAITGDNGCGKSTVLGIINGLLFADNGNYFFDGKEVNKTNMKKQSFAKALHKEIGYVFQNSDAQLFCSSVYDEIAFGPRQMGLNETETDQRVKDMLKLLNIEKLSKKAPYHLSYGEKKKVALAAVLAVNPRVLILDEPFNFLDKAARDWLVHFLLDMKAIGKTIIIVTHDDGLIQKLNARVIKM
ncbi:MAG: energy-coupling factor ABC transporter ATP-binding protein [Clostridium sp.]|nr:energy-coupling factor ABC transporter ATP-binding protein [Clostridium sp.]